MMKNFVKYVLMLLPMTVVGKDQMNVLMIAVDDMRPELGCYGASHVKSPNIDRLASEGVLFERAYCQQAICGASRASLLTGLRPDSSGVHGNHTHYRANHPSIETLPQYFKNRGYFSAATGKINHGVFPKGKAPKWDVMGDAPSWSVPAFRPGPRYYYTEDGIEAAQGVFKKMFPKRPISEWDQYLTFGPLTESPDVADEVLYDGQVARKAVGYLEKFGQQKEKPFFLAVGFIKPHSPYIAPKKYFDLYDPTKITLAPHQTRPEGAPAMAGQGSGEKRRYTDQPNRGEFTKENQQRTKQAYYACISYIDAQIGLVLDALEKNGLKENTVVILWSDHGYHLGEKGFWGKTTNYELDTRVAMICRAPGKTARGAKSKALVELVDVYPTLVDLCGLPQAKHLEGTSVGPLLDDPDQPWKKAAFSQFPRGKRRGYAVTDGRYRYVEWVETKDPTNVAARELYDHESDPDEMKNLLADDKDSALGSKFAALLNKGQGWSAAKPPAKN